MIRKKKKGYALIIVVVFAAFILVVGTGVLTNAVSVVKTNQYYEKDVDNVKVSLESGIEYAYSRLQKYCMDGLYNGTDTALTFILPSPTMTINDKAVQLSISADTNSFYIQATIGSKSMKARVSKIALDNTSLVEGVKLDKGIGLLIPKASNITNNDHPVDIAGVSGKYDLDGILGFSEGKLSDLAKSGYWSALIPTITSEPVTTIGSVNFITQPSTPFTYEAAETTIPEHTFTNSTAGSFSIKNSSNTGSTTYTYDKWDKVTGSTEKWYFGNKLSITPSSNSVDQDLSGKEIIVQGTVNISGTDTLKNLKITADTVNIGAAGNKADGDKIIEGCSITCKNLSINGNYVKLSNGTQINAGNFTWNDSNGLLLDNADIHADTYTITSSCPNYIQNNTVINCLTFTFHPKNDTHFIGPDTTIQAGKFVLDESCPKEFDQVTMLCNDIEFYLTNGTTLNSCNVTAGTFKISGSCPDYFTGNTIKCNMFSMDCSNPIIVTNDTIVANNLTMTGSTDRTFNNSVVVAADENFGSCNNIIFNGTLNITNYLKWIAGELDIYKITNMTTLNQMFLKAQQYVIINNMNATEVVTKKYIIGRLEYQ